MSGSADWMATLAGHFARVRAARRHERLLMLFEIDGVIVNPGPVAPSTAASVDVPAADRLLPRPVPGVLEVIRWFQLQPNTFVGVNSARPDRHKDQTVACLNALGRPHRVRFEPDLVHLDASVDGDGVAAKVASLEAFARAGYRIFAVVDRDPVAIGALTEADAIGEILFLHVRTPTARRRVGTPRTVSGTRFDLTGLIGEGTLPDRVELVWHGVNDEPNLGEFLASSVHWGECDIRRDPAGRLVLRHDSFTRTPGTGDEPVLELAVAVQAFAERGRGLKLDLKDGAEVVGDVVALIRRHELDEARLWFNAAVGTLDADGFGMLRAACPRAILQCPVDFLVPLVLAAPTRARSLLAMLASWGITRYSLAWGSEHTSSVVDRLQAWGYDVNIYAVPDHESFLQAALLVPRSLTADFNFPAWNYYGRGSGERRRYHRSRTAVRETIRPSA